ncbi:tetratricopeptide repeat protein 17-like [Centruroides sculpturatus]|uniref:tetratricopeptide repeat protein 17-like n=1 Tax=Centruroides sculpturatus TaxID=218467 RepID=UPI000C6CEFBC|nr:tetratricopeptide repeat protein 17-like [Centruroides sculpturatus]
MSGILNRYLHPHITELDVATLFKKNGNKKDVDVNQLEKKLRKIRKEKPNSTDTYNQIGNFWRIKGDTLKAIDCFRKTLSISPNDPDALLNLARILFNLQYLEDAIFLARRSVEVNPPQQSAWLHHFKLGEILKAYGHYHEASLQFKQTLELNPSFKQASIYLKEIESLPDTTVHIYTFFIIVILVLTVFLGILSTVEAHNEEFADGLKTKRHFNRAMAMRSIKLGMNPRNLRCRKYHS